jgi:hypothetical protein
MQQAAQTSILFRSKRTEQMVKHLAALMIGSIVHRLTPEDLASHVRKYPIHVWYALHEWIKTNLAYEIGVEISSGGGMSKQHQTGQLLQAAAQGAPISPQTMLSRLDLDPDVELSQLATWQRKVAPQQTAPAGRPAVGRPTQ